MKLVSRNIFRTAAAASSLPVALSLLSGCALGPVMGNSVGVAAAPAISGVIHGGPNPIIGARVVIYATTSTGYGVGQMLQEAKQVGSVAHQDTDVNGAFSFTGGYTCPAGQFAYVVAYGGNTGAQANNPNSVLMTALGRCDDLYAGTAYSGGNIWIDELTTVASGYALSNFINVGGDSVNGYNVGVGASPTNNAQNGCVANSYYGTANCAATATAGLRHAFANATMLVNTTTGQANATNTAGATIPTQFLNTLANVLQACVNSTGGGTNTSTGAPNTTTTSAGTSNDGTVCGKLFSYASYTSTGTTSGTLVAPGNTLDTIKNLAKRPTGSATMFASTCASNTNGTTPAATCIFNLAPTSGFYNIAMSAAPPDWTLGISYPKGAFNTASSGVTCSSTLTAQPTTNGLLYPYMVATDINDNVVILNGDAGTDVCYNLLTIGFDGSSIGGNNFEASSAGPVWVSTDAFGHAIVPVHSTSVTTANGVRIYDIGSSVADTTIPLVATITSTTVAAAGLPYYTAVDQNDNIYVAAQNAANDLGYITVSGSESHATPAYTGTAIGAITSKFNMISVDIAGNAFSSTSSSSGSSKTYVVAAGGGNNIGLGPLTGSTSNGETTVADTSGNVWNVQGPSSTTYTATQGSPAPSIYVFKQGYTAGAGSTPTVTAPTQTIVPNGDYKSQAGQIDGNNVIWVADQQGANNGTTGVFVGNIRGYDTVNSYDTGKLQGCKFTTSASTSCGAQSTDATFPNTAPYLTLGTRGIAVDAAGSIWLANGVQGQLNEIIGLANPTWPLFIHNGTSNKP
jgi:hypothetical protein